jgi:hypothetical protein
VKQTNKQSGKAGRLWLRRPVRPQATCLAPLQYPDGAVAIESNDAHVEYKLPDHPEQIMVFETHELAEGARRRGIVCVAMPGMNLHAAK